MYFSPGQGQGNVIRQEDQAGRDQDPLHVDAGGGPQVHLDLATEDIGQDRWVRGQDHVARGQDHVGRGQDHAVSGQNHIVRGQDHVFRGQDQDRRNVMQGPTLKVTIEIVEMDQFQRK